MGAELGQLTLTLSGTPGFRLLLFAPLCQNPLAFEDQQQQFYTNIISPPLPLIYVWFIVFVCVCSLCILLYSLLAFHLFNSHQLSFNKYILGDIHHLAWSFIYFLYINMELSWFAFMRESSERVDWCLCLIGKLMVLNFKFWDTYRVDPCRSL